MMGPEPDRDDTVVGPSDRSFGLTFGVIFAIIGLLPLWRSGGVRAWALIAAAVFLALAFVSPRALAPANRAWLWIGLWMHRIVNPVVMAVLFYAVVTPFGLAMRLLRAGLRPALRRDATASTYWAAREENVSRMDQQF
jgi:hypothetical protein